MTRVTGIQRNKVNRLDIPATHQRGVSGLCFTGADDEGNTARPLDSRASSRMTARGAVGRQRGGEHGGEGEGAEASGGENDGGVNLLRCHSGFPPALILTGGGDVSRLKAREGLQGIAKLLKLATN